MGTVTLAGISVSESRGRWRFVSFGSTRQDYGLHLPKDRIVASDDIRLELRYCFFGEGG